MNIAKRFVPKTKTASIASGASGWDLRGVAMPERRNAKGHEHARVCQVRGIVQRTRLNEQSHDQEDNAGT